MANTSTMVRHILPREKNKQGLKSSALLAESFLQMLITQLHHVKTVTTTKNALVT